jgi:hypothetical protein
MKHEISTAIALRMDHENKAADLTHAQRVTVAKRAAANSIRVTLSDEAIDQFKGDIREDDYGRFALRGVNEDELSPSGREQRRHYADYIEAENEVSHAAFRVEEAAERYDRNTTKAGQHYQANQGAYHEEALEDARLAGKDIDFVIPVEDQSQAEQAVNVDVK